MPQLTLLNSMAGQEFGPSLDQQVAWGIQVLDLKDKILGKKVELLTDQEAAQAAKLISNRNLSVYCLSTNLFDADLEQGESVFVQDHLGQVDRVIQIAKVLNPTLIRFIAATTSKRETITDSIEYLNRHHSWLIPLYGEGIRRIGDAGYCITIENEARDCIFSRPEEILDFFEELNCGDSVNLTWDVQNLWQMGTYPSLEVYHELKSLLGYYHLKGGRQKSGNNELSWRSSLEDATWPVSEITRQVIADQVSPVICLNGSHGKPKPDYDYDNIVKRDLEFLRSTFPKLRTDPSTTCLES